MDKKTVAIIILSCIVSILLTILIAWAIIGNKQYEDLRLKYEELCKITGGISGDIDDIGDDISSAEKISGSVEERISEAIRINEELGKNTDRAGDLNREAKDIIEELRRRNEALSGCFGENP